MEQEEQQLQPTGRGRAQGVAENLAALQFWSPDHEPSKCPFSGHSPSLPMLSASMLKLLGLFLHLADQYLPFSAEDEMRMQQPTDFLLQTILGTHELSPPFQAGPVHRMVVFTLKIKLIGLWV